MYLCILILGNIGSTSKFMKTFCADTFHDAILVMIPLWFYL